MLVHRAALGLLALGVLSVLNAFVATYQGAEKTYALDDYINTHWITTVIVFAGIGRLQAKERNLPGEVFSLTVNLISISVCGCAIGADAWNIFFILSTKVDSNPTLIYHLLIYNTFDIILCIGSISLGIYIVVSHLRSKQNVIRQAYSIYLFGLGIALTFISTSRLICYFAEMIVISHQDKFHHLFSNYTVDEPTWLIINIVVG
uniref:7TM_GPCR_Srx domain-containing protein n=1 Tax=Heterorhabditis bacteriophora TaxID=37862 RepID=A0A1I7WBN4_HETBA